MRIPRNIIIFMLWARLIICTALVVVTAPFRFIAWLFAHHLEYIFVWFLAIVFGGLWIMQGSIVNTADGMQMMGFLLAVVMCVLIFRFIRTVVQVIFMMFSPFWELNLWLLDRRDCIIESLRCENDAVEGITADSNDNSAR